MHRPALWRHQLRLRNLPLFKQVYSAGYLEGHRDGLGLGCNRGYELASRHTPCLLDESDTEYVVVGKAWGTWVIRPISQIILKNDGPDGELVEHLIDPNTQLDLPFKGVETIGFTMEAS